MAGVIHMNRTRLEDEGFDWMRGSSISEVIHQEPYSWWFHFSGGGECAVNGGTWRLSSSNGILASSDDHNQQFGLPAPVDSRREALAALGPARVLDASVGRAAPDLILRFEGGLVLELLTLSRGYECWEARDPSGRGVVVHGSREASSWENQRRD